MKQVAQSKSGLRRGGAYQNLIRAEKTDLVAMNNGNCAIGFTGTKVTAFDATVVEPTIGYPCW